MAGIIFRGLLGSGAAGGGGSEDYPFDGSGTLTAPWVYWGNITNPGGATLSGSGQLNLEAISNGTGNDGGVVIPTPAPDYEYEADGSMVHRDFENTLGMVMRESATGKRLVLCVGARYSGPGGTLDGVIIAASDTAGIFVRTVVLADPIPALFTFNAVFRMARTGSSLVLKCNYNGAGWSTITTRNLTDDFTTAPDQIGLVTHPRVPTTNPLNVAVWEYLDRIS
jgi:hypothetical protein